MNDYRLTIKVRNNRILKAIEAVGGTPGYRWCVENGLSYTSVNLLINMMASPRIIDGDMSKPAERLCEVLGKLPDELWSNEQLYPLKRNSSEVEMSHAQVAALLPGEQSYLPDFSKLEQEQTKALINSALSTLSPQAQCVIRMRFIEELTLEECGARIGLTKERIRQIEVRAMRRLREPPSLAIVVDAMDYLSDADRAAIKREEAHWRQRNSGVETFYAE